MNEVVDEIYENETAEELYERIQREKERLISEGKLKKQKKLPEISEDEIPFEIPKSWKWVRLGEVVSVYGGKRIPKGESLVDENTGYMYIRVSDMKNGSVSLDNIKYLTKEVYEKIKNYTISCKDIYITVAGTIGEVGIIPNELHNANLTENADKIIVYLNCKKYIYHALSSLYMQSQIHKLTTNVCQPKLAIKRINELKLALPPLSEQKRISELIDRLFEKLDEAKEKALSALNTFELRKAKILHLAIQGKLSKQLDEYKTAEELYEKIQIEKEKLISEGKLKKQKKLPEISEDEIPFEISKSWKWVRLGEIGITQTGTTPSTSKKEYFGDYIPFVSPADILNHKINYNNNGLSEDGMNVGRVSEKNSILQVCIGGSIGKTAITLKKISYNQQINAITTIVCNYKYIFYTMISKYFLDNIIYKSTGTATPIINKSIWESIIIPLPPLEEQKEIVKLLDNIFEKEENAKKLIESTLNKIELIKKSILARAVRGEL